MRSTKAVPAAVLVAALLLSCSVAEAIKAADKNGARLQQIRGEEWAMDQPVQLQPKPGRAPRKGHKVVHPPNLDPGVAQPMPPKYQAILDLHNSFRSTHQAPPLMWDDALAMQAAAYADTCKFEHGAFGENMFVTTQVSNMAAALDSAARGWYNEVTQYNFGKPGFTPGTGHFTQMVWKSSTMVGCAAKVCPVLTNSPFPMGTLVICRYLPFGNIIGTYAENVLPPLPPQHATFIPEGATLSAPDCFASPNDRYLLCMRRDSRLMLMHQGNKGNYTLWSSTNESKPVTAGTMQLKLASDGKLKVTNGLQKVIWSSASAAKGKAPRRLALHNNGQLALYDANNVKLWETDTAHVVDQWYGQLLT